MVWSFARNMQTVFLLVAGCLLLFLNGCGKPEPAVTAAELRMEPIPATVLNGGDVVDVRFFYVPELDTTQTIRPDGYISMALIGEVKAGGISPEQLREELTRRYAKHLKQPEVTVILRRVNKSRIYVGGEVARPGLVEILGDMSLLDAIMDVGGYSRLTADLENVLVLRNINGQRVSTVVNCRKIFSGEQQPVFNLHPQDIVFVPPTTVTRVNDWIEQYINRMIPNLRFIWSYPVGPDNAGQVGFDFTVR